MGRTVIDPEVDQDRLRRAWELPTQALYRFLLVAYTPDEQYYETTIEWIEFPDEHRIVLRGSAIPVFKATTFKGMIVYDDEGFFISSRLLDNMPILYSGDRLQPTYTIVRDSWVEY